MFRHETDFKATGPKFIANNKVKPFHGAHVYFMGFEPNDFEVMASGEYFPKWSKHSLIFPEGF